VFSLSLFTFLIKRDSKQTASYVHISFEEGQDVSQALLLPLS